jgi:nucleoside-diphosphate-sugar epimerase
VRVLVTGGTGVLGRALLPLLAADGHDVVAPRRTELDLFDPVAVARAVEGSGAVYHLATRIPPRERSREPDAWTENDRLRAEASRILVDAALPAGTETYVQPSVTFVSDRMWSMLAAERETARFADAGRRGVVLRLGLLDGPGTGLDAPDQRLGATLHVEDAGAALLAALAVPSGIYHVARNGGSVSAERFAEAGGWRPRR